MPKFPISDDELRAMYAGGRGNETARWWARFWGRIQSWGVLPPRWVTLEVPGRVTGRPMRVPLGMADVGGRWYLVSMLGECNWVRNARANRGEVVLHRGRRRPRVLREVPVDERGPILQRYVAKVPGGRPHIPVAKGSAVTEFTAIADRYPVFEVRRPSDGGDSVPARVGAPWVRTAIAALAASVALGGAACRRRFHRSH